MSFIFITFILYQNIPLARPYCPKSFMIGDLDLRGHGDIGVKNLARFQALLLQLHTPCSNHRVREDSTPCRHTIFTLIRTRHVGMN